MQERGFPSFRVIGGGNVPKNISLVLSGYYGFDNAGDEAILLAVLQKLKSYNITPIVLSGNPAKTSESYGVKAVNRMNLKEVSQVIQESDGLISGGGSLLQDATSARSVFYYLGVMKIAQFHQKPVFCYAQGVGPLRRRWIHPFVRFVLNRCEYLSVRDPHSKTLLEKIGIDKPIDITMDPVLSLKNGDFSPIDQRLDAFLTKRPLIISPRNWEKSEYVVSQLSLLIEKLRKQHIPVLLLPFHAPYDTELVRRIKQAFSQDEEVFVAENIPNVKDFIYIINNGYLMVGMRLHALVFAASQSTPFVGISYDPKIDAFLDLFDLKAGTTTKEWDVDGLYQQILDTYDQYDENVMNIENQLHVLKEQEERPMNYIKNYFKEALHDQVIGDSIFYKNNERNSRHTK